MQGMQCVAQIQISMPQSERAFQVKNDDAFAFPLFDVQTHAQPPLAQISGQSWLSAAPYALPTPSRQCLTAAVRARLVCTPTRQAKARQPAARFPPRDLVKRNPPHRFVDRMSPYLDLAQQTSLPHILRQPVQTREAIARPPLLNNCPRPEALLAPAYRGVRISSVPRSELPANCTAALSKPKTDYAPLNSGRLAGPDVRIHQPQRDAGHD